MLTSNVKIVIWDLDDTFWEGTLSEGGVVKIDSNICIIKQLIDRGIMCSIVSKNNYEDVKAQLEEWGIWDCFIFPHISWMPKGEQVHHLLSVCSLRAENALFIDDNNSNLKEVEFYNPRIMTALPDILNNKFLDNEYLRGKNDIDHSKLKQYKILEKRNQEENQYSSNEDFLRSSGIQIDIDCDCINHIDRIHELIQRTNQLNYTKKRIDREEILQIVNDASFECACVSVSDKFGEYGIVGFYALRNGELEHFVFSCRTIGFGIENYLYKKLNYPIVNVVGDISIVLSKEYAEKIDWVHECRQGVVEENNKRKKNKILMIAGCDLEQACTYIESDFDIKKEFNTVVEGSEIRTSDTSQLLNAIDLTTSEKRELCENLSFFNEEITFNTEVFSGNYRTIVISVVDDYIRGIWRNKTKGYEIGYGGYYCQEESLNGLPQDVKNYLESNFVFVGREDATKFRDNLERIIKLIGKDAHIILINGVDIDVSKWIGEDRVQRNREMNGVVDDIVNNFDNVDLVDMRLIVNDEKLLVNKDNRHFDRYVYYILAKRLSELCDEKMLKTSGFVRIEMKRFFFKVINKIIRGLKLFLI